MSLKRMYQRWRIHRFARKMQALATKRYTMLHQLKADAIQARQAIQAYDAIEPNPKIDEILAAMDNDIRVREEQLCKHLRESIVVLDKLQARLNEL